MSASEIHNMLARKFVDEVLRHTTTESEAMVVAETALFALMLRFRPSVKEAVEFLDAINDRVLGRLEGAK